MPEKPRLFKSETPTFKSAVSGVAQILAAYKKAVAAADRTSDASGRASAALDRVADASDRAANAAQKAAAAWERAGRAGSSGDSSSSGRRARGASGSSGSTRLSDSFLQSEGGGSDGGRRGGTGSRATLSRRSLASHVEGGMSRLMGQLPGGSKLMGMAGKAAGLAEAAEMAALGPVGLMAAAAVTAAKAIFDMTKAAADAGRGFSDLQQATGSTGLGTARLRSLGSSIGLSSEATGSLSSSFSHSISSDPVAMSFASRAGVSALPRPYGNVDEGKSLMKMADYLRSIKDSSEQIRVARATGTEALLPATKLSDQQYGYAKTDAGLSSLIFDPSFQKKSADFSASLGRLSDAFVNLMSAAGESMMEPLTRVLNSLADALNLLALIAKKVEPYAEFINKIVFAPGPGAAMGSAGYHATVGSYANAAAGISSQTEMKRSMDANTGALGANTAALGKQGSYGRGSRANPIQGGMSGMALRRGLEAGGYRLGSF